MTDIEITTKSLIVKTFEYNGKILTVDFTTDAYINATEIAKAFGKKPSHWLELDSTKEYIFELAGMSALQQNQLVTTKLGSPENGGGTWLHPDLGVLFARWLNVRFAIWADRQIKDILIVKKKDMSDLSSLEVLKEYQKMVAIAIEKEEKIQELKLILNEKDKVLEKYKLEFDEGLIFVSEFSNQIGIGVVKFSDILKYLDIVSDATKTVNSKYSKYFKYTKTYSNKLMVPVLKVNSDGLVLLDDLVTNGLFKINNVVTKTYHTAFTINSLKRIEIPALILPNLTTLKSLLNKY
jgi:hypothetical protein